MGVKLSYVAAAIGSVFECVSRPTEGIGFVSALIN